MLTNRTPFAANIAIMVNGKPGLPPVTKEDRDLMSCALDVLVSDALRRASTTTENRTNRFNLDVFSSGPDSPLRIKVTHLLEGRTDFEVYICFDTRTPKTVTRIFEDLRRQMHTSGKIEEVFFCSGAASVPTLSNHDRLGLEAFVAQYSSSE
jgi:hypothetical protein